MSVCLCICLCVCLSSLILLNSQYIKSNQFCCLFLSILSHMSSMTGDYFGP
jgi:hypothetical protein